jgi:hypothetical protein
LSDEPAAALLRVSSLGLALRGGRPRVFHDPSHEGRALELQSLIGDALVFYEEALQVELELSLAVLDSEAWSAVGSKPPYGFPYVAGPPYVAFLPATHDGWVTRRLLAVRPVMPPAVLSSIEGSGFTYEQAARTFVDLIGVHEVGHPCARVYGIRVRSRWLDEIAATYFAYVFLHERRPALATLWRELNRAGAARPRPEHVSLADFDRRYLDVGPANYGWYQAHFQRRVEEVYGSLGIAFLPALKEAFAGGAGETTEADAILRRLESLCPGFLDWSGQLAAG